MLKNIEFNNKSCSKVSFEEPNICPMCSHCIQPILLSNRLHFLNDDTKAGCFSAFFECTHCHKSFISTYDIKYERTSSSYSYYVATKHLYSAPSKYKAQEFPKCISENYQSFVKIYNQSLEAEHYNLDEIAGIGYRKALEFLIKDFLILYESKDETKVKITPLGTCINTMIENPQLKTVASRATWLGNDQTHYEQKYTDKDINDLKKLIKLSVNWIEMIYLTDEAEDLEKK